MKRGKIYTNLDINEYHSDKTKVSSTGAKEALKSSRDFAAYLMREKQEYKKHFDFGNLFEIALIDQAKGTNDLQDVMSVIPTQKWIKQIAKERPELKDVKKSKDYKKKLKSFLEINKELGRYVIPDCGESESYEVLQDMVASVQMHEFLMKILKEYEYQPSFFWQDEETGVECKTRPDLTHKLSRSILDIKTGKDASPKGFAKQVANLDYPLQALMQIDGAIKSGYMDRVDNYYWLVVEKNGPSYHYCWYRFQQMDIESCRDKYRKAIERAAKVIEVKNKCKESGLEFSHLLFPSFGEISQEWSGNSKGLLDLELPLWYHG